MHRGIHMPQNSCWATHCKLQGNAILTAACVNAPRPRVVEYKHYNVTYGVMWEKCISKENITKNWKMVLDHPAPKESSHIRLQFSRNPLCWLRIIGTPFHSGWERALLLLRCHLYVARILLDSCRPGHGKEPNNSWRKGSVVMSSDV